MNLQFQEDTLDAHFEALRQQGAAKAGLIETSPGLSADFLLLFAVARLLWDWLRPVKPAPAFRNGLGDQLTSEARRRRNLEVIGIERVPRGSPRRWVAPVVALGAASLVGAYAWRRRVRQSPEPKEALAA